MIVALQTYAVDSLGVDVQGFVRLRQLIREAARTPLRIPVNLIQNALARDVRLIAVDPDIGIHRKRAEYIHGDLLLEDIYEDRPLCDDELRQVAGDGNDTIHPVVAGIRV